MNNKILRLIILAIASIGNVNALREMVVAVPVANLRSINGGTQEIVDLSLSDLQGQKKTHNNIYKNAPSILFSDNPYQCSQVLFGERVFAGAVRSDGWVQVQAVEQKVFANNGDWVTCSGFLRGDCLTEKVPNYAHCFVVSSLWANLRQRNRDGVRSSKKLSLGSCLSALYFKQGKWLVDTPIGRGIVSADDVFEVGEVLTQEIPILREGIVRVAKKFLNSPYIWGGGSAWRKSFSDSCDELCNQITGVDCSSLAYLSFKSHGLLIPRNSHSQYLSAIPINSGADMHPGDLIFWENKQSNRVSHVAIYIGNDLILEANGKIPPFGVRIISSTDCVRLGKRHLVDCSNGDVINWQLGRSAFSEVIHFGSFFLADKLQQMRRDFFCAKRSAFEALLLG